MPEFFLELFSEEIPARMQAAAAAELSSRVSRALNYLRPENGRSWFEARRIAFSAILNADDSVAKAGTAEDRGPRSSASEAAVAGFLKKHDATRDELVVENGYFFLRRKLAPRTARETILKELPKLVASLPWPKSMRWGQSGDFIWVRPLRRIVCLLDGEVVPIKLGSIVAGNETEGHRFQAPGPFSVISTAQWEAKLEQRFVIASPQKRRQIILEGLRLQADQNNLSLVEDVSLLDEVAGLVEWPVPLLGRIDRRYMALPPEVRELSMKVNQRYFALRGKAGESAPSFAFVANIEAEDGGAAIIAGNERVLRARLADAEHFWEQDRKHFFSDYLPKLKGITFHAKLGTQYERAERIAVFSREIADLLGADGYEAGQAEWAGRLCKADLVTGMVGEFPELQGIMGSYYVEGRADVWDGAIIGPAIRTHYQPKGPNDEVPHGIIGCAVALADKLDTLREFFRIGEKPTGSGDPYALRRAALGVIRIIRENNLSLHLKILCGGDGDLFNFLIERLRVLLRSQGERYDVLDAVFAAGEDDDINSLLDKMKAVGEFLGAEDGANLLTAYRRAANILRIENARDGPHEGKIADALLHDQAERDFNEALNNAEMQTSYEPIQRGYGVLLSDLATLRAPVDAFFEAVKINADDPELRKNRLKLLAKLRDLMHQIADFSKIEG